MRLCEKCLINEAIYDGYCEECYTVERNSVSLEYGRKMKEEARLVEIGRATEWFFDIPCEIHSMSIESSHDGSVIAWTKKQLLDKYRKANKDE